MFWRRSEKVRKTALLTISIIIGRASTFLFFVLIGNKFGVSDISDQVWASYAPVAVILSVMTAVVDGVLLPIILKAGRNGLEQEVYFYFFKKIPWYCFAVSACIIVPFAFLTNRFDWMILCFMLPIPYLYSISLVRTAMLNARGFRNFVALSPVSGFIFVLFVMFLLPIFGSYFALLFLVFELGRLFFLSIPFAAIDMKRAEISNKGNFLVKEALNRAKYQVVGVAAWSMNYLVDIWFASKIDVGAVTSVEYANRIWLVVPLFFQGILLLFYINCARNNQENSDSVNKIALKNGIFAGIISIPIFIFSKNIVILLYGYGNIDAASIEQLTTLLRFYLIGCGPYVAGLFYARSLFAKGENSITAYVGVLGVIVNTILNYVFIQWVGINGIGLATSITLSFVTIFLILYSFIYSST